MTKKKPTGEPPGGRRTNGPVPYDMRVRIVRHVLRGRGEVDVAVALGISHAAVQKYLGLYRRGGMDALEPLWEAKRAAAPAKRQGARRQAVVEARTEHPDRELIRSAPRTEPYRPMAERPHAGAEDPRLRVVRSRRGRVADGEHGGSNRPFERAGAATEREARGK